MKLYTLTRTIFAGIFILFVNAKVSAQDVVTVYTSADVTLGSGVGQSIGDFQTNNLGGDVNVQMCNFDDDANNLSYFEGWIKFNLSELTVPEGKEILYAKLITKVSANDIDQGYSAYHLFNADDWEEGDGTTTSLSTSGGLTWSDAQDYEYEKQGNFSLLGQKEVAGGTSAIETMDVTEAVKYELGASGNKILTIRVEPFVTEYDAVTNPKKWLGFFAREAPWGEQNEELGIAADAAHIEIYIGDPEPTVFSNIIDFGTTDNYTPVPADYGYWLVRKDEGGSRLKLAIRPMPINQTPGGFMVYNSESYGDFEFSLKAKTPNIFASTQTDFIVIFGYEDAQNYAYMSFTGEATNGFYLVSDFEGIAQTLIGDVNPTPALTDSAYHDYLLKREGNQITVLIDSVEYMSVSDDALGKAGMLGVGSYNDIVLFDNLGEGDYEFGLDTTGQGGVGLKDLIVNTNVKLYPNPANDILNIRSNEEIKVLKVMNMVGQHILTLNDISSQTATINTSEFKPGLYVLTLVDQNEIVSTAKFMVK